MRPLLALVMAVSGAVAHAGCATLAPGSPQAMEAARIVRQLPEFRAWRRYVRAHPPAKVIFGIGPKRTWRGSNRP